MSKSTEIVFILASVTNTIFSGIMKEGSILEAGSHIPMEKGRKPERDFNFTHKNIDLKVTLVMEKEMVLEF